MASVDDLTELVEASAAAERLALASKWKERPDVAKMVDRTRRRSVDQMDLLGLPSDPLAVSSRWVSLRQTYIGLGVQDPLPEPPLPVPDVPAGDVAGADAAGPGVAEAGGAGPDAAGAGMSEGSPAVPVRRLSHAAAAQAERDAAASVTFARIALTDAALAVLQARLARIDAGDDEAGAAVVDGHVPLHGRNPVSQHGSALAHGLSGEIKYVIARKPRGTLKSLAVALAMGLLYLGFIRVFEWDKDQKYLPYLGLFAIGAVMGGGVCINAMSFDAMRVRAALDSGTRLWHLLVIKNLALLCIVAPVGFILCGLLAWRAGDVGAFFKGCALMICLILLWLGVGNILSVVLPSRDEPIRQRRQSGSLKQFIIKFVVAYAVGYLVNAMLVWRIFAAQQLASRLHSALVPAIAIILSSLAMWVILTIVAVALAEQPKIKRMMQREITDYKANAEMKALAAQAAEEAAAAALHGELTAPTPQP